MANLFECTGVNASNNTIVDADLSSTSENAVQNKVIKAALDNKANASDLSTVATSGSYNDLDNKPTLSAVATSGSYDDLEGAPDIDTLAEQVIAKIEFAEGLGV